MRFYSGNHPYYCGIDLHAKQMYTCIIDKDGNKLMHRNVKTDKQAFLKAIAPYREDLVVSAECMFTWYWVADRCRTEQIPFVLGHALFMKAVHAAKHKNDKIDAEKIARLLRGGNLPMAYVYPEHMRAASIMIRNEKIKTRLEKDTARYGKPGAMRRLTQRLARTVYYMIKKGQLFDQDRFVRA